MNLCLQKLMQLILDHFRLFNEVDLRKFIDEPFVAFEVNGIGRLHGIVAITRKELPHHIHAADDFGKRHKALYTTGIQGVVAEVIAEIDEDGGFTGIGCAS